MATFDSKTVSSFVEQEWDATVTKTLEEYISIPNTSPLFDDEYYTNGLAEKAVDLLVDWVKKQNVAGLKLEVFNSADRTPLIFLEYDGDASAQGNVLLYGHLDKQPPMDGFWEEGLGPCKPVIRDGKLYGRGGADDGYSIFAAVLAIDAMKKAGHPVPRCSVLIEACEESGSRDLPYYVDLLKERIGNPSLIVCLDSGCGNYEQLWITTSLRGAIIGNLDVKMSTEGVHSGKASGIMPSTFRILRLLMNRVEDPETGRVIPEVCYVDIPERHQNYAREVAKTLGDEVFEEFPFLEGCQPVSKDAFELTLNRTWRPALSTTGVSGIPDIAKAGNVLRTNTAVKLSIRMPPSADTKTAGAELKRILEADTPYGANVTFDGLTCMNGWVAPDQKPWLEKAINDASNAFFDKPARYQGEGGSIPFMGMLGAKFPEAQFAILGVLGPESNAHGPNEFLHLQMAKNVTKSVAFVLHAQAGQS